ncbi:MAG: PorV/PorQ family protein [Candidatus Eisenbacteria bacterium]
MRLSTTWVLAAALGLVLAGNAHAQGTGRSLDIQPGARQNGMGAAGVALAEDATGVTWWNPAGLGFVQKSAVEITYAKLVPGLADDVSYNYATFVKPLQGWGAFGLGLVFLSYGTSEGTDGSGQSTGSFTSNEISPALYYGARILPDLSVGASLKYIRIQLAPNAQSGVGSTFGLDVGALYNIPAAKLKLGANIQNLGPSVTFVNEDQRSPLSRNLKVGAAWEASTSKEFRLLVLADFNQSLVTSGFYTYNAGVELKYTDQLAGRIGYYYDPLGDIRDITYGIGLGWKGLALDYASIPQAKGSNLPNVNKITLGYRF